MGTITVKAEIPVELTDKIGAMAGEISELRQLVQQMLGGKPAVGWCTITSYIKRMPCSRVEFDRLRAEGKAPQRYGTKYKISDFEEFLDAYPNYIAPEFRS